MWFRKRAAAREDALIALVQHTIAQNAARDARLMEVVEQVVAQSAATTTLFSDYLKVFTQAPKPEVRVMDDATEAALERAREASRKERLTREVIESSPVSIPDFSSLFAELKGEVIN